MKKSVCVFLKAAHSPIESLNKLTLNYSTNFKHFPYYLIRNRFKNKFIVQPILHTDDLNQDPSFSFMVI